MPVIPRPKDAQPAFGNRAMLHFGRWPKRGTDTGDPGDEPEIREVPNAS